MKLANFYDGRGTQAGLVIGRKVVGLADIPGFESIHSVDELLASGHLEELRALAESGPLTGGASVDSVRFRSPVTSPDKVLCAAVNYASHGKEGGTAPAGEPYFFTKFRSSIIGDGDPILIPRISKQADWEAELAVIIGRRGKYISRGDAMSHVAGYTIANDISFRDLQFPQKPSRHGLNWVKGKALDRAFPLGPWLATKDEIPDPQRVRISLTVNGVPRQNSNTADMIFDVSQLIEYASSGLTLLPGDVISTGTPSGVAYYSGAPFLKDGDVVVCEIEGIGKLRNPVVSER
jgi:2-keto-4-pentenoate hydratase/2-oxohepta-3-ene-1,7-dioic acid hydratase in catechol pathway